MNIKDTSKIINDHLNALEKALQEFAVDLVKEEGFFVGKSFYLTIKKTSELIQQTKDLIGDDLKENKENKNENQ